ncbi:MAG TPA: hypothetical protein DHV55_13310 [Clostridiaceae bacterium]|nr:hypothetical protein [Clostridiaceae bacterium]
MTWKIGIICAGDRAIFKEHHTKDNNASLQGRIELGQEVGAPYCLTGYEHRRGGYFLYVRFSSVGHADRYMKCRYRGGIFRRIVYCRASMSGFESDDYDDFLIGCCRKS